MPDLSIIIPVFNECESLPLLYRELREVAAQSSWAWEFLFVDDGSTDGSWHEIQSLADADQRVQGIRFRRNFGKASAIRAGYAQSRGKWVVTIDADLQDDPREIVMLIEQLEVEQLDLVSGWKRRRQDPWTKRWPSRLFNWLITWMTGVRLHDHNCGLKAYRREVLAEIDLYGDRHRFIPVLAAARGFRLGERVVHHRPRQFGRSKYGWGRLPKGALDLLTICFLTGFHHRPQHILGGAGLISFGLGTLGLVTMAVYWVLRMVWFPDWTPVHQRPLVLYSVGTMLLGAQLLSIGFLAELLVAHTNRRSTADPFSVRETVGGPTETSEGRRQLKVVGQTDPPTSIESPRVDRKGP